jgi:CheY-like chemotaxis protein
METVLLVDDERMVRELVGKILRMRGYTVLEANCGADALRICEQHAGPIHLLLTDVLMPEMNGRTLAERVVAVRPHTRVLFMSGYVDGLLATRFERKTEIPLILKPFTSDALARKVREVLSASR